MNDRAGIKTTEFWLTAIAQLVGLLVGLGLGGKVGSIVAVASTVLVTLGYTAARGKVKAASKAGDPAKGA